VTFEGHFSTVVSLCAQLTRDLLAIETQYSSYICRARNKIIVTESEPILQTSEVTAYDLCSCSTSNKCPTFVKSGVIAAFT